MMLALESHTMMTIRSSGWCRMARKGSDAQPSQAMAGAALPAGQPQGSRAGRTITVTMAARLRAATAPSAFDVNSSVLRAAVIAGIFRAAVSPH